MYSLASFRIARFAQKKLINSKKVDNFGLPAKILSTSSKKLIIFSRKLIKSGKSISYQLFYCTYSSSQMFQQLLVSAENGLGISHHGNGAKCPSPFQTQPLSLGAIFELQLCTALVIVYCFMHGIVCACAYGGS